MERIQPQQEDCQQEANRCRNRQEDAKPQIDRGRLNIEQGIVAKGRHDDAEGGRYQQSAQGDQESAHPKVHTRTLVTGLHFIFIHHLGHDHIADQDKPAQADAQHDGSCIGKGEIRGKAHRHDPKDHHGVRQHERPP